ncbi:MAG: ATP synthase subunit I [Actinobacteria bacterium]|nr:ATP synthase subunit I [Actinomycetota bacterium]
MSALDVDTKISILSMRDTGPAPEAAIVRDIIKHGLIAAPVLIAVSALIWGANGAYSCAYALAIVFGNFGLAAALVAYTARISYALMMAAMLFGYLLRLALVAVAVFVVRQSSWVELIPLGLTIILAHLGLLFWELRYVSLSLAYPGLKPKKQSKEKSTQQSESAAR